MKKMLPVGYSSSSVDVYKVTLRNPAKTPEIRERLFERGFEVFEADIPFKYRFLSDFGIGGTDWIEVKGSNGVNTNTVQTS